MLARTEARVETAALTIRHGQSRAALAPHANDRFQPNATKIPAQTQIEGGQGGCADGDFAVAVSVGYPGAETCLTLMTSVRSIA